MFEITSKRLTLRPTTQEDADLIWPLATNFEVVRHTGTWPWPADVGFTKERCAVGFTSQGGWLLACDGDQFIGTIGLQSDGDFGYMIAPEAWGQGYATEMGRALVEHAKNSPHWTELKACVFDDNPASARVLEKLGFVETGKCQGHCASRHADFPIRTFTQVLS